MKHDGSIDAIRDHLTTLAQADIGTFAGQGQSTQAEAALLLDASFTRIAEAIEALAQSNDLRRIAEAIEAIGDDAPAPTADAIEAFTNFLDGMTSPADAIDGVLAPLQEYVPAAIERGLRHIADEVAGQLATIGAELTQTVRRRSTY